MPLHFTERGCRVYELDALLAACHRNCSGSSQRSGLAGRPLAWRPRRRRGNWMCSEEASRACRPRPRKRPKQLRPVLERSGSGSINATGPVAQFKMRTIGAVRFDAPGLCRRRIGVCQDRRSGCSVESLLRASSYKPPTSMRVTSTLRRAAKDRVGEA